MRKLQTQLALSHVFPLLVLLPVLGFLLLYLLETRYFVSNFANELEGQGVLVAEFTRSNENTWTDPATAMDLLVRLEDEIPAQISFYNAQGDLLATSASEEPVSSSSTGNTPITEALHGHSDWVIERSLLHLGMLDMAIPVADEQGNTLGVVRLQQPMASLENRLVPLRWLMLLTFSGALVVAVISAALLARSLSRSLASLAAGVRRLVPGEPPAYIPETGPDEVRAIADNFNSLAQRLFALETDRRKLLANIVHELGRPLGAIKAALHALQEDALTDPEFSRKLVSGITDQVDQLHRLVDDLSLLAESELHEPVLQCETICLAEIVTTQCGAYAHLMQKKNIEFRQNIDPVRPVLGDKARLMQILGNLLHNAYKYTPSNGCVTVSLAAEGGFALLRVSDTGPGIERDEQSRIFTLFYRAPSKGIHKGMGIGLAIARKLTVTHDGTLTVTSEPGKGATFTLRLPTSDDAASPCT